MKKKKPTEVATAVPYNAEKEKFLLTKRTTDTDIHPSRWDSQPASREEAVQEDSKNGVFGFPGGHIEDESPEKAALRELLEETGLNGKLLRTGESFTLDTEDGVFRIYPFLVLVEDELELNPEHTDYEWIEPGELENFDTVEGLDTDLERLDVL